MDPLSIVRLKRIQRDVLSQWIFRTPPHGFSVERGEGQSRHRVDRDSQTDVSHSIREEPWSGWEGKKKSKAIT